MHPYFGGIQRLYGDEQFAKIQNSHVLIVGIGGVGSWVAESLARSGVGALSLVDLDDICQTNINRQIHALHSTVGKSKVAVLGDRLRDINPKIDLHLISDYLTEVNSRKLLNGPYHFVVDAIDRLKFKCEIINRCKEFNLPLLVTGGAAGKRNPLNIQIDDLADVGHDHLLFRVRKKLRQKFEFPKHPKKMKIQCVYCPERTQYYDEKSGEVDYINQAGDSLKLDCHTGLGQASFITGAMGLIVAGYIINKLID